MIFGILLQPGGGPNRGLLCDHTTSFFAKVRLKLYADHGCTWSGEALGLGRLVLGPGYVSVPGTAHPPHLQQGALSIIYISTISTYLGCAGDLLEPEHGGEV